MVEIVFHLFREFVAKTQSFFMLTYRSLGVLVLYLHDFVDDDEDEMQLCPV